MNTAQRTKTVLLLLVFGLLTILFGGLFWFFTAAPSAPVGFGWYLFSFAAGLTMIVLPCTLPLAFVIVPLSMGKGPVKGFAMALAFGTGVALTLSVYGVLAAAIGKVAIGSLGAPLEVVKNWMYLFAGTAAYLFALGELGLIRLRMPTYSGAAPMFIQKQRDLLKAFFLGLFLGNIGVGCPHPATPVILTRIAVSGDIFYGWLLFFVHAVGRVLPLLLLALLGIMGVNALSWLVARREKVERATGWGMVFVAGFILVLGLFSHDWWVYSGQHTILEEITQEERFLGAIITRFNFAGAPHVHGIPTGSGLFGLPLSWGNWALVLLWVVPLWWAALKTQTGEGIPEDVKKVRNELQPLRLQMLGLLTGLLGVVFILVLPDRFYLHAMLHDMAGAGHMMPAATGSAMIAAAMPMAHTSLYHEEADVTQGLAVNFVMTPRETAVGIPAAFTFFVNEKPGNTPVTNLEVSHEKLMHVIGVRSDLSGFFHIHPQDSAIAGTFRTQYAFESPGNYKVWSEVTRAGVNHVFGHQPVTVSGPGATEEKNVTFNRSAIVDSHQVALGTDGVLVKGKPARLTFDIHDALGAEAQVEPYLAADMHLTIIKDDRSVLLHTHPDGVGHMHAGNNPLVETVFAHEGDVAPASTHGIGFSVTFPQSGIYRAFAQFRPRGTALPPEQADLASFWIKVEEKPPLPIPQWWLLLIVSLTLIAVAVTATRRYLSVDVRSLQKKGAA